MRRWMFVLLCVALPAGASELPDVSGRSLIDQALCEGCHRPAAQHWTHTVHGALLKFDPAATGELAAQGCQACHGPGSAHLSAPTASGTIIGFARRSATPVAQQNAICLQCHQGGQQLHWTASAHDSAEVACSDCHNPMARFSADGLLAADSANAVCNGCHQTQRAEFERRSHMPLGEGKLRCLDCHAPHGSVTDPLLNADSVNETCFACHAEKRGPYLWEHAPVTDDCTLCHRPHGSNHDKLLVTARPVLCQQCHNAIGHVSELISAGNLAGGSRPDPRAIGRSCNNCHSQIHGSNHPAGSRFQR